MLSYTNFIEFIRKKPVKIHLAKASFSNYLVKPVYSKRLSRTSDAVKRTKAVAGINGGYFSRKDKLPYNRVIIDGKEYKSLKLREGRVRSSFVVDKDENVFINRFDQLPSRENILHLLQAGPLLLKDWRVVYNRKADEEYFRRGKYAFDSDITKKRYPRSAFGKDDEYYYLISVDGRQKESGGLTLKDLAYLMKRMGIKDGLNLDGGGSSSLVFKNKLKNTPIDKKNKPIKERKVVTHLCVYKK